MARRFGLTMRARGGLALLALALAAGLPRTVAAQAAASPEVVLLRGRQLVFGSLIPGVPERVSVGDAGRRAEVVIEGSGTVELMLLLPPELQSPDGGRIPLRFGLGDAAVLAPGSVEALPFDPHRAVTITLHPERGPTRILLGGTAVAGDGHLGGSYSATISVAIVQTVN